MSLQMLSEFLLWCTAINYALLLLWFGVFAFARGWLRRLHGRWFRLSDDAFDAVHYGGMAVFKLGIFLFNLTPWIALQVVT